MNPAPSSAVAVARRPRQGLGILFLSGVFAMIGGWLLYGAANDWRRAAGCVLALATAWLLARAGRRRRIPVFRDVRAIIALAERHRLPLTVYLRRFTDDGRADHPGARGGLSGPAESEVAAGFAEHSLFVALGRPGELLPTRGAYRVYVPGEHWQAVVRELLSRAAAVVCRWAPGAHLDWELAQVRELGRLERTLFLLPPLEAGGDLRSFLPDEFLGIEFDAQAGRHESAYAAFATVGAAGGALLHFRHREEALEDAAGRVAADVLDMEPLDRSQRLAIRQLHGRTERTALAIGRICVVVPTVVIGLSLLVFLDIVTFQVLDPWLPSWIFDALGIAVLVALALFFLGSLFIDREVGRT